MAFGAALFENYGKDSGGGSTGPNIFYNLSAKSMLETGAPAVMYKFEEKEVYGRYELGWFLAPLSKAPYVFYHPTATKDLVLCAKTFNLEADCPACVQYEYDKGMGTDSKQMYIKHNRMKLGIPFIAVRRQQQKHIYKGKSEVLPIYWFEMECTGWIEEHQKNFTRLKNCDVQFPTAVYPYMIFAKDKAQSEKQDWYFQPITNPDPSLQIIVQHPLVDNYIKGQFPGYQRMWDDNYFSMLENLYLLKFKAYVNPSTGETFDYGGYLQRAYQTYESMKAWLPAPTKKLEAQATPGAIPGVFSPPNQAPFST